MAEADNEAGVYRLVISFPHAPREDAWAYRDALDMTPVEKQFWETTAIQNSIQSQMKGVFGNEFRKVEVKPQGGERYFVIVEFKARESLTMGMVRTDIETRMSEAFKSLFTNSGVKITSAILVAYSPLQDRYGNVSDGPVYRTEMDAATGARVRWERVKELDFSAIWKTLSIDPGLRE